AFSTNSLLVTNISPPFFNLSLQEPIQLARGNPTLCVSIEYFSFIVKSIEIW
ncbi:unnamed protein product, partial [marine sediment metagenome]